MRSLFKQTLVVLDTTFNAVVDLVPEPQKAPYKDEFVFRFKEQTIHQAIILKFARMITGLRAALALIETGLLQEEAAIQRILDEIMEDTLFLVYAVTNDEQTDLHKRYLNAFFQEEFSNPKDPVGSQQDRPMIPRKKIRAYITRIEVDAAKEKGQKLDQSHGAALSKTLHKTYSGYIHAAAPHVMDLYGGNPPRFYIEGMLGTPLMSTHQDDLLNYFYRGLMTAVAVARSFGDKAMSDYVYENLKRFEKSSGLQ